MIVPRSKLLWWVAWAGLPLGLLGAIAPALTPVALAGALLFLLVVAIDALRAYAGLAGVSVELQPIVRLSKDREGRVDVRIKNAQQNARRLQVGLALPAPFQSPQEIMAVQLPAGSECSRIAWPCTATRRGNYRLDRVHLEGVSPMGLWAARESPAAASELRVYPNLFGERKQLAALFLNRGMFGLHARRQVGKGRDFEKLREYVPGDSFDDIHWKATARRARPITKIYQIEKTQEVYVIVDSSRLSARAPDGAQAETALERFVTSALVLGLAAEHQGDLFGLLTFSDGVDSFVRAKNGKAHYQACRDTLYTLHPSEVAADFDEVASFIRQRLRRRALLIFLTSLDDPILAESFTRNMEMLCRQHLILVNVLRPRDAVPLFSKADVAQTSDIYRHLSGHLQWQKFQELQRVLQRRGIKLSLVDNEKLSFEMVSQYVEIKQRQLI